MILPQLSAKDLLNNMREGFSESRFRVNISLPVRNDAPYFKALNWLSKKLNREYLGVTWSIYQPTAVFRGYYYSDELNQLVADWIVILISDVLIESGFAAELLEQELREIKRELHKKLPKEKEFWIVYHPVTRILSA
jgi:hypothetical protein